MLKGIHDKLPNYQPVVIQQEAEAIDYAITNARGGDFIVICSDVVPDALNQIMRLKEAEDKV
jgi:cyanophycin synthetase